ALHRLGWLELLGHGQKRQGCLEALRQGTGRLRRPQGVLGAVDTAEDLGEHETRLAGVSPAHSTRLEAGLLRKRPALTRGRRHLRPCGASKSSSGPKGTTPVGLMVSWLP